MLQKGGEQRRSPRHSALVPLDLVVAGSLHRVHAINVSRHGIFVATENIPRERFVLQALIHLPDGTISATGYVSRVQATEPKGFGLQFFALSQGAKERWDRFVRRIMLAESLLPGQASEGGEPASEQTSFLVKLETVAKLRSVVEGASKGGSLYLATPVIRDPGSSVFVILIHPASAQELILPAKVARVREDEPPGMELTLSILSKAEADRAEHFVREGAVPQDIIYPEDEIPLTERPEQAPEGDFDWEAVKEELIIDMALSSKDVESSDDGMDDSFKATTVEAQLICEKCGPFEPSLSLGEPSNILGVLSSYRLYWCPSCKVVRSLLRLKPLASRHEAISKLESQGEDALLRPVPLSLVLEAAELGAPPTCSECESTVELNAAVLAAQGAFSKLESEGGAMLESTSCPRCHKGIWKLQRL